MVRLRQGKHGLYLLLRNSRIQVLGAFLTAINRPDQGVDKVQDILRNTTRTVQEG